jgi:hypothetical protein
MLQDEENNQLKTQLQKQREEERLTQEYLRQYGGGDVNTTPIQQQDESLMTCQLCNKLVAMDELEFMDVR